MSVDFGLYPLTGLAVGGLLYAIERWVLRLRCSARWVQAFIALSMTLTTLLSVLTPVRFVNVAPTEVQQESLANHNELEDGYTEQGAAAAYSPTPTVTAPVGLADEKPFTPHHSPLTTHHLPLTIIYCLGVALVVLYFAIQLCWLASLRRRYPKTQDNGFSIYHTDNRPPFSFGTSIFLPACYEGEMHRYVLIHELSHVRHRHFLKLCALQLLVAINWYNPFVWLLFSEMRLQQELEVDTDVLATGIDRKAYQLSLLSVCTQEGRWILLRTAFGLNPLKQRIIFMNKQINSANMRRRQTVAALAIMLVTTVAPTLGCQQRQQTLHPSPLTTHHPMRGCWTMDWISNTGSGEEVHPVAMHYGFYNDSTFLCFSYWSRKGVNMRFAVSGEGYSWRGDTLLDANDYPTDYTFTDDQTAISRWMKDSTQMAGVSGPDITEQWHRIAPATDIVTVFRAAYGAKQNDGRPLDGVWLRETPASDGVRQTYCLVSDTIFMLLNWHPSTVARGFRYGGSGFCGTVSLFTDHITQPDADHLVLSLNEDKPAETYRRIPMPPHLLRAFAPAAFINEQ